MDQLHWQGGGLLPYSPIPLPIPPAASHTILSSNSLQFGQVGNQIPTNFIFTFRMHSNTSPRLYNSWSIAFSVVTKDLG